MSDKTQDKYATLKYLCGVLTTPPVSADDHVKKAEALRLAAPSLPAVVEALEDIKAYVAELLCAYPTAAQAAAEDIDTIIAVALEKHTKPSE